MRWSNLAQNTLGILLGLMAVIVTVGVGSFLVLQQLSRSPSKPVFAAAQPNKADLDIRAAPDSSYPALVVYQGDLMVRDTPQSTGKVLDKVQFDHTVIVLGKSEDGVWENISDEAKGIQGWVAAGNLKRAQ
ncbi:MAG: SH3 domain-containing protein [Thermosynechococcaceae cyanobacterium]